MTVALAQAGLNLFIAACLGASIGLERQWRQHLAGLRTNTLVALGAAIFITYGRAVSDADGATRIAAQVVSGIGFLGAGIIFREGMQVSGLNTAATLWCSAAVGVLAAGGHFIFALIATGAILGIHLLGRPLGHLIDRDNVVEEDEDDQPYQVQLICRRKSEKYARAQIVQHTSGGDFVLRGIHTGRAGEDSVALTAYLLSGRHAPARLEELVADLSLQEGVQAVHWYAGDQDDPMPRAPLAD